MKNRVRLVRFLLALLLSLLSTGVAAVTLTVVNGNDNGAGSLRAAIAAAAPSGDIIEFAAGVTQVTLTSGELVIAKDLEISATGPAVTISRNSTSPPFRVFRVLRGLGSFPHNVTFRNLIIRNGVIAGEGGGIYSGARLLMFDTVVDNNQSTAGNGGGGFANESSGQLLAFGCTFSNNSASLTGGGLLQINGGILYLYESLVKDNVAANDGGGLTSQSVTNTSNADVFLRNTTFVGNSSTANGSAIVNVAAGGGDANMVMLHSTIAGNPSAVAAVANFANASTSTLSFSSSLFANNGGPNLIRGGAGATSISEGFNLSDDATAGGLASDQINTNPVLAPLANYGGPRFTFALLPGSPAINRGNPASPPSTDNRGIGRVQLGTPDIGAYESRGFTLAPVSGNNQSTQINTGFAAPLVVAVSAAFPIEPVVGGRVAFLGPMTGPSATVAGGSAPIGPGATASGTAIANIIAGGPYSVSANATGVSTPVSFSLSNTAPILSVSNSSVIEGSGGVTNLVFTITATPAVTVPTTVEFATADGSAGAPNDYTALAGQRTFNIGESVQLVSVPIVTDSVVEGLENLTLTLSNPGGGATLGTAIGTGAISNDDSAVITIDTPSVLEGSAGFIAPLAFTVSLSQAVQGTVGFNFASADGNDPNPLLNATLVDADYTITAGSSTFTSVITSRLIAVPVVGDPDVEPDQQLRLVLSGLALPPGISPADVTFAASSAIGTVLNDDGTIVSVGPASIAEATGSNTTLLFPVTLSAPSKFDVTVQFATNALAADAGTDFIARTGTLTFPSLSVSQTVAVTILGDDVVEASETLALVLSTPTGATLGTSSALGTVLDNDTATVSIANAVALEGNVGATPLAFLVTLSNSVQGGISATVNSADGINANPLFNATVADNDYVAVVNGSVSLAAGSTVVVVSVTGDSEVEPDQFMSVGLSNLLLPAGVTPGAVTFAAANATGRINNDDAAGFSISNVTRAEGNAATSLMTFTVALSAPNKEPVRVDFATSNSTAIAGSDYLAQSGVLNFAPGVQSLPVQIVINGDVSFENDESFGVSLSNPSGASIAVGNAIGTIQNDDAPPVLTVEPVAVIEGNSGLSNAFVSVRRNGPTNLNASVTLTTSPLTATAPADYQTTTTVLTFAPNEQQKLVLVPVVGDTQVEADETFTVRLLSPNNATVAAPGEAIVTILNDDGEGVQLALCGQRVEEGGSTLIAQVSRAGNAALSVTWGLNPLTATPGQDYAPVSGVLQWLANDTQPKTISVPILDDALVEPAEEFVIALGKVSPGAVLGSPNLLLARIEDNDERLFGDGLEAAPCLPQ